MFIDQVEIEIAGGKGGDGAVAFRREKFIPKGGPSGGNGGRGGSIIMKASHNLHTLLDLRYKRIYKAPNGQAGAASNKDGKSGEDIIIPVPVGTIVKNLKSGEVMVDFTEDGQTEVIAEGGRGGKGNSNFATPTKQTPRYAEPGKEGEKHFVSLELKLIADTGLVGFPNAGKSTLISTVSAAKPKIADYPFTTLEPNLGIVKYKDYKSFTIADIPGIIEGAHTGKGLGIKFLKHIERTKILLFLIDITSEDIRGDFDTLFKELRKYSSYLIDKKMFLALTKADLVPPDELSDFNNFRVEQIEEPAFIISAVSGYGIKELLDALWTEIEKEDEDF